MNVSALLLVATQSLVSARPNSKCMRPKYVCISECPLSYEDPHNANTGTRAILYHVIVSTCTRCHHWMAVCVIYQVMQARGAFVLKANSIIKCLSLLLEKLDAYR